MGAYERLPPRVDDGGPGSDGMLQEAQFDEHRWHARLRDLLDKPESSGAARAVHYFVILAILASTAGVILETLPELRSHPVFLPLEVFTTLLFTAEFALRLYVCRSLRAFVMNTFNFIDFLAIFPGYIALGTALISYNGAAHQAAKSLRTLRMVRMVRLLRVLRVMRVAKAARHSQSLGLIFAVVGRASHAALAVMLMLLGFAAVLSASIVYIIEDDACDDGVPLMAHACDSPTPFQSVPASLWWAISTLTTVGYGDMVPRTVCGRVVGGLTAVSGIMIVAIGIALVSKDFREGYEEEKARYDVRRQTLTRQSSTLQDRQVLLDLHEAFNQSSDALLTKLRKTAPDLDCCVMLDMLARHVNDFSANVVRYSDAVLSSSMDDVN